MHLPVHQLKENLTLIEMLKKQSFVEREGSAGVVFTHFQNPFFFIQTPCNCFGLKKQ
jgi:hypothetical protein